MAISSGGVIPFAASFNPYGLKEAQEGSADQRNYLLKSDGTNIYGNKIYWDKNDKNRYQIFIDDSSYQISDILACRLSNASTIGSIPLIIF